MMPAVAQLLILALLLLVLLVFVATVFLHRLRQEILMRRWHRQPENGRRREAFRRAAVRARRAEPILNRCILIAGVLVATLVLAQLVQNIVNAF